MKQTVLAVIGIIMLLLTVSINAETVKTFTEGDLVKFDLSATDPDGDPLAYAFSAPLDENGRWQTGYGDAGTYTVTITVSDGKSSASQQVKIIVLKKDRAPEFEQITQTHVNENDVLRIELKAADVDNDVIKYSAEGLPKGAVLEGNVFTYKPGYDVVSRNVLAKVLNKLSINYAAKKSFDISFIAESNGLKAVLGQEFTVVDTNIVPVIENISDISVDEGDVVELNPDVHDSDGDNLKLSYSGWMHTNNYITNFDDSGEHTLTITATDGISSASKDIKVIVKDVNRKPELDPINPIKLREGEIAEVELISFDPDNDKIIYSLTDAPINASVDKGVLTWTPSYDTVKGIGVKDVKLGIELDDGTNKIKSAVPFVVENVNQAPVILSASPDSAITVAKGARVIFSVSASDPDEDELEYLWEFGMLNKIKSTSSVARTFLYVGTKKIKVTVADGSYNTEKEWVVKVI